MADNRADLINQLAASMRGDKNINSTGAYARSRYDMSTGTLYVKDVEVSASSAADALEYFSQMRRGCNLATPDGKRMAAIYQCAIESINVMKNDRVREVIKEQIQQKKLFTQ